MASSRRVRSRSSTGSATRGRTAWPTTRAWSSSARSRSRRSDAAHAGARFIVLFETVQIGGDVARLRDVDAGTRHGAARIDGLRIDDPAHQIVGRIDHAARDVNLLRHFIELRPDAADRAGNAGDGMAAGAAELAHQRAAG